MPMLLAAALAALAQPAVQPRASARVSVRIVAPARVSAADWTVAPGRLRRETLIHSETGQRMRVRLIEYQ